MKIANRFKMSQVLRANIVLAPSSVLPPRASRGLLVRVDDQVILVGPSSIVDERCRGTSPYLSFMSPGGPEVADVWGGAFWCTSQIGVRETTGLTAMSLGDVGTPLSGCALPLMEHGGRAATPGDFIMASAQNGGGFMVATLDETSARERPRGALVFGMTDGKACTVLGMIADDGMVVNINDVVSLARKAAAQHWEPEFGE